MKKSNSLPNVLTINEVKKIISSIDNLKHKAIISTIYSCGLRISEAVNLEIKDIDSSAMTVKIVNAKGKNDRYVMLSPKLLELLREYFVEYKPKKYLFTGQFGDCYSPRSIQQIFNKAVKIAGIKKELQYILYDTVLRHTFLIMEPIFDLFRSCLVTNIYQPLKFIPTSILFQLKKLKAHSILFNN